MNNTVENDKIIIKGGRFRDTVYLHLHLHYIYQMMTSFYNRVILRPSSCGGFGKGVCQSSWLIGWFY